MSWATIWSVAITRAYSREEDWRKCAQLGLQGMPVPTEYGGLGVSATTIAAALEGLGYGCPDNGLIFSLNAQMWAVRAADRPTSAPRSRSAASSRACATAR